ncbi:DNA-directed RNA polymerases I, II, and III subunit RPABC1 [Coelomomyces lativittatus]|nr:DNA-directed RNA polymerases I, II, and III subunit RPABC1 [Coelomomyces lativittatus]
MLADRGYVIHETDLNMTLEEFTQKHAPQGSISRSDLLITATKPGGTDQIMISFFEGSDNKKVGIAPIRAFCEKLIGMNINHGIIVHQQPLSSQAHKVIQQVSEKYRLEAYEESKLIVNITHHVLVPKHQTMTQKEKKILLERYRAKESQLPRILSTDPVAEYLGLKRGEVVKIIRNSETAGRYVTYRLCM